MFQEYDVVILTQKDPETPLPVGTQGTVLICHFDNHYDVEFMNKNGETLGVYTVSGQNLRMDCQKSMIKSIVRYRAAFLLLFPLLLIGLFLGMAYWGTTFTCEEDVVLSIASPQGHFAAMLGERACGATTVDVSVIAVAKRVPTGIAEKQELLVIQGARPLSITWEGEAQLVVHVPAGVGMSIPKTPHPTVNVKVVEE